MAQSGCSLSFKDWTAHIKCIQGLSSSQRIINWQEQVTIANRKLKTAAVLNIYVDAAEHCPEAAEEVSMAACPAFMHCLSMSDSVHIPFMVQVVTGSIAALCGDPHCTDAVRSFVVSAEWMLPLDEVSWWEAVNKMVKKRRSQRASATEPAAAGSAGAAAAAGAQYMYRYRSFVGVLLCVSQFVMWHKLWCLPGALVRAASKQAAVSCCSPSQMPHRPTCASAPPSCVCRAVV